MSPNMLITLMVVLVLCVVLGTIILYIYLYDQFCGYHGYGVIDEGVLE